MDVGDRNRDDELERAQARLREADHRIKNDLQLIASVFILQMRKLPPGPERDVIRGAVERLSAVSAVHRRLDASADPRKFDASALVREVAEEALGGTHRDDIGLELAIAPVTIPARQATPLALVAGELLRNSLEHAFHDRGGTIKVSLGVENGAVTLCVTDDGDSADCGEPGFGATLVGLLAQQLRGEVETHPGRPGVIGGVRFPESA